MTSTAVHAFVRGRVQGVAFRYHSRREALELGLRGWVRNLADGRVELWAEGPPAALEAFVSWLAEGPRWARVDELSTQPSEALELDGFEIR